MTHQSVRQNTTGVAAWVRSFPTAGRQLLAHDIHRLNRRKGETLTMRDGRRYVVFRETVKDSRLWADDTPTVLQARFHLRLMKPERRWLYSLFRPVCIMTTPFFVGLTGFRSKLWMLDESTGDFAGLYEWDTAGLAQAYERGLVRILRALSKPGTVSSEVVEGQTVDRYLSTDRAVE